VSIDQLPSGKYRSRYYVEGKQKSKTFTLKRDAEKFDRDVHRAIERGELDSSEAGLQTLAELAAEHMASAKRELATRTFNVYRSLWAAHVDERILGRDARQTHRAIAETSVRLITPKLVESWRNERLAAGAGESSIRKTMALLQTIMDRAERDGSIPRGSNPVRLVKKPSGKRKGEAAAIPPEKVEQIRAKLDDEGKALVSLLAYSGMRPGEALALRWSDVGTKTLRIEGGTNPDGSTKETKTGPARSVVLLTPLAADLKKWRKLANGSPLVFGRKGASWTENDWRNWRKRKFAPAAEAAGVQISRAYDLRGSVASLWLQEGINPMQVAAWLGDNVATIYRYYARVIAELDPADKTSATERIKAARRTLQVTGKSQNKAAATKRSNPRKAKTRRLQAV
jgi:integrase